MHGGRENLEAVAFLQEMNATAYKRVPGAITIAEESTSWPGVTRPTHLGGLGFGFKWNMGWMHDSLGYVQNDPIHRQYHHGQMTFSLVYAYSENYVLPISHDEVVHGKGSLLRKMPGDRWQQLANLRTYLAYMWAHPGKQLLFMGTRVRPGVRVGREPRARLVAARQRRPPRRALAGARHEPDLQGDAPRCGRWTPTAPGFQWIDANDAGQQRVQLHPAAEGPGRRSAGVRRELLRRTRTTTTGSGCPQAGTWTEVLNTDAERVRRLGRRQPRVRCTADEGEHHGQPGVGDGHRSRRWPRSGSDRRDDS